uniref:Uncharacterized protein n=1 Tax=viral metagenome TaxID=1070528 RepID=A0A6C0KS65_9ZZZZ
MSGDFTLVSTNTLPNTNTNTITGNIEVNSDGNTTITFLTPFNQSIMFSSQDSFYEDTFNINNPSDNYNGTYSGFNSGNSTNVYLIDVSISGVNVNIYILSIPTSVTLSYKLNDEQITDQAVFSQPYDVNPPSQNPLLIYYINNDPNFLPSTKSLFPYPINFQINLSANANYSPISYQLIINSENEVNYNIETSNFFTGTVTYQDSTYTFNFIFDSSPTPTNTLSYYQYMFYAFQPTNNVSIPPSLNYSTAEVQTYQNTNRSALMVLKNLDPEDRFTKMVEKEQIASEVAKIQLNGKRLNVSLKEIAKIILKNVKC